MRLQILFYMAIILWVAGCGQPIIDEAPPAYLDGVRVDTWQMLMYESVQAGDVLGCPYVDCVVLAQFGFGQPLPVVGMIGGEGGWWYIVPMGDGEGFVQFDILVYSQRLNLTPVAPTRVMW